MQIGDYVAIKEDDTEYFVFKVLKIDQNMPVNIVHCVIYQKVPTLPTVESVLSLDVMVWHGPFGEDTVASGTVVCNIPVTDDELQGYFVYLENTNFPRYLQELGLRGDQAAAEAYEYYLDGFRLGEENQQEAAIVAYTQAIDRYPLFIEAIENRGLTYMEMNKLNAAIAEFENSISQNDDTMTAWFSMGECYLKMGNFAKAEEVFIECDKRWPNQQHIQVFLQGARQLKEETANEVEPNKPFKAEATANEIKPNKPWWKFGR